MGLVDTCTKYGYMKAHTKDMHDYEELSPKNMNYGNLSQQTCKTWIKKVSGLAKFGLGNSFHESNMHHHTYHFTSIT